MAEYLQGFAHTRPIRGSPLEMAARDNGWHSEPVLGMIDQRIRTLSSILACTRKDTLDTLLDNPVLIAVDEGHMFNCLLRLRELLPEADVSRLIREKVDLLLRPDAMEKAAEAVRVLAANNLDPSETVQKQPILLLVHQPRYDFDRERYRNRTGMGHFM